MSFKKIRARSFLAALLGVALLPARARAQTTGANQTHDPSRMIESDGRFYFCSTGGSCASSADGLAWTTTGLHIAIPSWSTTYMSGGNQGVWAPDIVFYDNQYYIYRDVPAASPIRPAAAI
jgi:beta-xylosidase